MHYSTKQQWTAGVILLTFIFSFVLFPVNPVLADPPAPREPGQESIEQHPGLPLGAQNNPENGAQNTTQILGPAPAISAATPLEDPAIITTFSSKSPYVYSVENNEGTESVMVSGLLNEISTSPAKTVSIMDTTTGYAIDSPTALKDSGYPMFSVSNNKRYSVSLTQSPASTLTMVAEIYDSRTDTKTTQNFSGTIQTDPKLVHLNPSVAVLDSGTVAIFNNQTRTLEIRSASTVSANNSASTTMAIPLANGITIPGLASTRDWRIGGVVGNASDGYNLYVYGKETNPVNPNKEHVLVYKLNADLGGIEALTDYYTFSTTAGAQMVQGQAAFISTEGVIYYPGSQVQPTVQITSNPRPLFNANTPPIATTLRDLATGLSDTLVIGTEMNPNLVIVHAGQVQSKSLTPYLRQYFQSVLNINASTSNFRVSYTMKVNGNVVMMVDRFSDIAGTQRLGSYFVEVNLDACLADLGITAPKYYPPATAPRVKFTNVQALNVSPTGLDFEIGKIEGLPAGTTTIMVQITDTMTGEIVTTAQRPLSVARNQEGTYNNITGLSVTGLSPAKNYKYTMTAVQDGAAIQTAAVTGTFTTYQMDKIRVEPGYNNMPVVRVQFDAVNLAPNVPTTFTLKVWHPDGNIFSNSIIVTNPSPNPAGPVNNNSILVNLPPGGDKGYKYELSSDAINGKYLPATGYFYQPIDNVPGIDFNNRAPQNLALTQATTGQIDFMMENTHMLMTTASTARIINVDGVVRMSLPLPAGAQIMDKSVSPKGRYAAIVYSVNGQQRVLIYDGYRNSVTNTQGVLQDFLLPSGSGGTTLKHLQVAVDDNDPKRVYVLNETRALINSSNSSLGTRFVTNEVMVLRDGVVVDTLEVNRGTLNAANDASFSGMEFRPNGKELMLYGLRQNADAYGRNELFSQVVGITGNTILVGLEQRGPINRLIVDSKQLAYDANRWTGVETFRLMMGNTIKQRERIITVKQDGSGEYVPSYDGLDQISTPYAVPAGAGTVSEPTGTMMASDSYGRLLKVTTTPGAVPPTQLVVYDPSTSSVLGNKGINQVLSGLGLTVGINDVIKVISIDVNRELVPRSAGIMADFVAITYSRTVGTGAPTYAMATFKLRDLYTAGMGLPATAAAPIQGPVRIGDFNIDTELDAQGNPTRANASFFVGGINGVAPPDSSVEISTKIIDMVTGTGTVVSTTTLSSDGRVQVSLQALVPGREYKMQTTALLSGTNKTVDYQPLIQKFIMPFPQMDISASSAVARDNSVELQFDIEPYPAAGSKKVTVMILNPDGSVARTIPGVALSVDANNVATLTAGKLVVNGLPVGNYNYSIITEDEQLLSGGSFTMTTPAPKLVERPTLTQTGQHSATLSFDVRYFKEKNVKLEILQLNPDGSVASVVQTIPSVALFQNGDQMSIGTQTPNVGVSPFYSINGLSGGVSYKYRVTAGNTVLTSAASFTITGSETFTPRASDASVANTAVLDFTLGGIVYDLKAKVELVQNGNVVPGIEALTTTWPQYPATPTQSINWKPEFKNVQAGTYTYRVTIFDTEGQAVQVFNNSTPLIVKNPDLTVQASGLSQLYAATLNFGLSAIAPYLSASAPAVGTVTLVPTTPGALPVSQTISVSGTTYNTPSGGLMFSGLTTGSYDVVIALGGASIRYPNPISVTAPSLTGPAPTTNLPGTFVLNSQIANFPAPPPAVTIEILQGGVLVPGKTFSGINMTVNSAGLASFPGGSFSVNLDPGSYTYKIRFTATVNGQAVPVILTGPAPFTVIAGAQIAAQATQFSLGAGQFAHPNFTINNFPAGYSPNVKTAIVDSNGVVMPYANIYTLTVNGTVASSNGQNIALGLNYGEGNRNFKYQVLLYNATTGALMQTLEVPFVAPAWPVSLTPASVAVTPDRTAVLKFAVQPIAGSITSAKVEFLLNGSPVDPSIIPPQTITKQAGNNSFSTLTNGLTFNYLTPGTYTYRVTTQATATQPSVSLTSLPFVVEGPAPLLTQTSTDTSVPGKARLYFVIDNFPAGLPGNATLEIYQGQNPPVPGQTPVKTIPSVLYLNEPYLGMTAAYSPSPYGIEVTGLNPGTAYTYKLKYTGVNNEAVTLINSTPFSITAGSGFAPQATTTSKGMATIKFSITGYPASSPDYLWIDLLNPDGSVARSNAEMVPLTRSGTTASSPSAGLPIYSLAGGSYSYLIRMSDGQTFKSPAFTVPAPDMQVAPPTVQTNGAAANLNFGVNNFLPNVLPEVELKFVQMGTSQTVNTPAKTVKVTLVVTQGPNATPAWAVTPAGGVDLTGLIGGAAYTIYIGTRPNTASAYTSVPVSSFNMPVGPDVTPPVISAVSASGISGSAATIKWSTNEASDTLIEYGTTTSYGNTTMLNAAMVTSHTGSLSGLTGSTLYHYRVKSKDAAGNMVTSGDFTFTTLTADTTPPAINSVSAYSITAAGATISWHTSYEASDTQVEYGTSTSYGSMTTLNAAMLLAHGQTLTGLNGSTLYHYRVRSKDAAGNVAISGDYTFTTLAPPDTTAPLISAVNATNITAAGATIGWTTNENSNTQIEYGTTTSYGSTTTLNGSMVTSHSQSLTGLNGSTLYHYRVKSKDAAGNLQTSADFTFTTVTPSLDAMQTLLTTTQVSYQVTGSDFAPSQNVFVWLHKLDANGNLTSPQVSSVVLAADAAGKINKTFTSCFVYVSGVCGTPEPGAKYLFRIAYNQTPQQILYDSGPIIPTGDTTPPVISGVSTANLTQNGGTMNWTTNEASDTQIEYGLTTAYGSSTALNTAKVTSHSATLSGLTENTLYHYRLKSRDAAGNLVTSQDYTFTTLTSWATSWAQVNSVTPSTNQAQFSLNAGGIPVGAFLRIEAFDAAYNLVYKDSPLISSGVFNGSLTVTGLTAGKSYTYKVSAILGLTSFFLSEGSFSTPAPPDVTPPTISAVNAVGITANGATINWTTNEASDTQVQYRVNGTTLWTIVPVDSSLVTSHSVNLTGLNANTLYQYQVLSRDAAGNLRTSTAVTFTTPNPPDVTAPVITVNPAAVSLSTSGGTITWTTNEASDTQIEYGLSTAYGSSTALNTAKVTSHSQAISGLTAGTLYHYRVKSKDAAGNIAISADFTFTTAVVTDTTPPVMTVAPSVSGVTAGGATIGWTTNENSTTQVQYRVNGTSAWTLSTLDSTLSTGHSLALTGLNAGTVYQYQVMSKDAAGNLMTSAGVYSFTTPAAPDTTKPLISAVNVSSITSTSATITWTTDEASDTRIFYGLTPLYQNSTALVSTPVTSHKQVLTGLTAGTLYHFSVESRDAAGNWTNSIDYTFTTPAVTDTTPPVMTVAPSVSGLSAAGATIGWTTNENSTTQVQYRVNGTTAWTLSTLNSTLSTGHSLALTGLNAGTVYQYQVMSKDAAGNLMTSAGVYSFTTPAAPDTAAPVITVNPAAVSLSASGGTITWTTNEASDTQIEYGLSTAYGSSTALNTAKVTSHSQAISGLTAGTLYHYRVKSKDAAGNLIVSQDFTFTTPAAPVPVVPTAVSAPIGGEATFSISSAPQNLPVGTSLAIRIFDANGNQVGADRPIAATSGAKLSVLLAAGNYKYAVYAGGTMVGSQSAFSVMPPAAVVSPSVNVATAGSAKLSFTMTNYQGPGSVIVKIKNSAGVITQLSVSLSLINGVWGVSNYSVKLGAGAYTFTVTAGIQQPSAPVSFTVKAAASGPIIGLKWR